MFTLFIIKNSMNTAELFNHLNDELCYDLMGEIILDEYNDKIIWTYNVETNINIIDDEGISEDDVEIISLEEKLQDAHHHDINLITNNMVLFGDKIDWYFTEPILNSTTIISEIFKIED